MVIGSAGVVRSTDGRPLLGPGTKGLSLLSDPTDDFAQEICAVNTLSSEQRKAVRSELLETAGQ